MNQLALHPLDLFSSTASRRRHPTATARQADQALVQFWLGRAARADRKARRQGVLQPGWERLRALADLLAALALGATHWHNRHHAGQWPGVASRYAVCFWHAGLRELAQRRLRRLAQHGGQTGLAALLETAIRLLTPTGSAAPEPG